ncbi:MAG TPA: hypothetical protein VMU54_20540, partial [Planctomycetota bacterium]|nr:hypothetical protein [Planctomycetota bacterium]
DEAKLKNGDQLSGRGTGLAGRELLIVIPTSGPVKVDGAIGCPSQDFFPSCPKFRDSRSFQMRNEATLGTAFGIRRDLLGGVIPEFDRTPSPVVVRQGEASFIGLGFTG